MHRNKEGYADPTVGKAVGEVNREENENRIKAGKLIGAIKRIVDIAGFELQERVTVKDKETGRVFR